ncbi:homoserine O-acetyltransferase [Martiniozyma asiatica (nom. inval.)]|nr:homoserine O-acetyltransferase [Martiniozyma asiatica]
MPFKKLTEQPENPFSGIVPGQTIVEIPEFELESGEIIFNVPVAYKTWGKLNDAGDNCMIITHALTGSADVFDWWGPLLGRDKAFDPTKFFIICLNSLGSPYGSASPLTHDHEFGERYGPEFPICTVRDDVTIHKMVLDDLGVKSCAICIGGSMGGMLALEWTFVDGGKFVKNLVALATSAKHSAWCISWGEAQRQCIYSDPKYEDGYYSLDDPPLAGLGAARMSALLTYRSRNSFETRFGRGAPTEKQQSKGSPHTANKEDASAIVDDDREINWSVHNDGSQRTRSFESHKSTRSNSVISEAPSDDTTSTTVSPVARQRTRSRRLPQHYFSAQSYLRYQAQKFTKRFDANCYISITRKLDTHDLGRDRPEYSNQASKALQSRTQPALIIGISSDALFTLSEQIFIAKHLPNSTLKKIDSPEGHDAFLLEFDGINKMILDFERENLKDIMEHKGNNEEWDEESVEQGKKESVFGEAEDVAQW